MSEPNDRWGRDVLGYAPVSQFDRVKREKAQSTGKFVHMAKRWLIAASRNGSISIKSDPCYCGRNHYSIQVGTETLCPTQFLLGMTALMDTEQKAKQFLERCKPSSILKRVDKDKDANFTPGLHKEKETN